MLKSLHSVFESELGDVIPVLHATIAGTRCIGRLTAGKMGGKYIFALLFRK